MYHKIRLYLQSISWREWALFFILAIGIFLRIYHFSDWLSVLDDQIRDNQLVEDVISGKTGWPLLGPFMSYSGASAHSANHAFHLGPMHYYFQIISVKIFGDSLPAMAYPDLLFGILAIPLFYYFLKKYFSAGITLVLTALYSVSFYAIEYSRFAWNSNAIPFFILLLLVSFNELLEKKEKTPWLWSVAGGIALGVGIQLHVITLAIFIGMAAVVSAYLLVKNPQIWKKIVLLILISILLNAGQIISEMHTGFANTKILFSPKVENIGSTAPPFQKIVTDIDCQAEANLYMLSSFGNDSCGNSFIGIFLKNPRKEHLSAKKLETELFFTLITIFSLFGYVLLVRRILKEKSAKRKNFLNLVALYVILSFLVMLPLCYGSFTQFRYFISMFFISFILLGLFMEYLINKFSKNYFFMIALFIFLLISTNLLSVAHSFRIQQGSGTDIGYTIATLGDITSMTKYITDNSQNHKNVFIIGAQTPLAKPINYLAGKRGFRVNEIPLRKYTTPPLAGLIFYIGENSGNNIPASILGMSVESYKNWGAIRLYKLSRSRI